ncbi:MAG: hypothetical protein HZB91_05980 [Elusimicrobia bacterium]|nr:hypothetical protein [Elusimicrobiota bacterium]
MNSEEAALDLSRGVSGVLNQDETWGGTVRIAGDVVVAEGSTLRITAGAAVVLAESCSITVLGRLIVKGTDALPASISGPGTWGGIHAKARGRVLMRHARLSNAAPNLILSGQGRMDIADCSLSSTHDANAVCSGGFLKIKRCALDGPSASAIRLQGGRHRLSSLRITGAREGVVLTGAAATARDLACSRCQEALIVRDGSTLELDGAAFEGGKTGLTVIASKAAIKNASFQGFSDTALSLHGGGGVRVESCRISRCRVGMTLSEESGDFTGLAVDGCADMGVYAPSGRHRFLRYAGPPIVFEEAAQVDLDDRPLSAKKPSWSRESSRILRLVLRTQDIRPIRAAYRALYFLGELAFRAMTRLYGNAISCDAWRGWKRGDWSPGVSDLDFVVVAAVLSSRSGKRWLAGFWKRHARLKRVLPFLGETVVVLEPELQEYLAHGGVRARELAVARRRTAPGLAAEPKRRIALWAECASSYTRLIEWLWHRNGYPWAFRRTQLFKSSVDLLRHLPETESGPNPVHPSRKAFWENIRATPFAGSRGALQGLLDEDSPEGPHEALLSGLWAHLLAVMHRCALGTESRWSALDGSSTDLRYDPPPRAEAAGGKGASLERWSPQVRRFQDHFGAGLSGALFSDLYPSYAILSDEELSKAGLGGSLARCGRSGPASGLTIILSRRLWRLWSCLPFAENPLLFMDAATAPAGRLVPMRGQFSWADTSAPTPLPTVLSESARQSLAQLRLIRRWLGSPSAALNGRCALHYLLSRAMGLRLLTQRRIAAPFFDLDHLVKAYSREFPDSAAELSKISPEAGTRSVDEAYWACHDFLESALSGAIR